MNINLQYGTTGLPIDVPGNNVRIIEPTFVPGLTDEAAAFAQVAAAPLGGRPLREIVQSHERLAVVIPDGTRPLPSDRLLPWLFKALPHVPDANIVIINGTGSHRANTQAELAQMVGADVLSRYRVVNHDAHDPSTLALAGTGPDGRKVYMNREYVEADKRIALGFIEPHFMAGFSGGYKGIFPAIADINTIMHYHRAQVIGDPRSTWGRLHDNPTQDQVRAYGQVLPLDFLLNVTLNRKRQITRFFCGDPLTAHEAGCAFAKSTAMVACPHPYPIVVTSNSGFPLDQNLYQTVKGMSAAAQIVADGGLILAAARCNDGFPAHGNFREFLTQHASPQAILDTINTPGFSKFDQWQAQLFALIANRAKVGVYSEMADVDLQAAHIEPVKDISARLTLELQKRGLDTPIAVLPEGPMTIPYLA
ncbi:MAG: nickel-dependent lactate racemase [Deltaproteobacteria bacterium]|nr:nickel-dependent lactate racemase [Deltaproteobacteria bacterium]